MDTVWHAAFGALIGWLVWPAQITLCYKIALLLTSLLNRPRPAPIP
jgi:hypothetical protein